MVYYFDMDGVLADWVGGFESMFPKVSYADFGSLPDIHRDDFRSWIDSDPNFYADLVPFDHVLDVVRKLVSDGHRVEILSSVGEEFPDLIIAKKLDWVARHLGSDMVCNFVNKSSEKARYAHPDAILFDDRVKSIDPFSKAGGIGVLYDGRSDVDLSSVIDSIL